MAEDGRPEAIRYFSLDTNLPLTLALDVDTSGSVREALDAERTASQSFLDDMLGKPEDKAAVLHFDREVELLEDLTSSKPKLREALNQLGPTQENGTSTDNGVRRRGGGTQLYDAILLSANDLLANQAGRKAIIVLSDGQDRGSKETLNEAVEAAQKAEAVVYTIYFKGEDRGSGGFSGPGGGYPGGWRIRAAWGDGLPRRIPRWGRLPWRGPPGRRAVNRRAAGGWKKDHAADRRPNRRNFL